jgi:NhaP-type Na+/H+ or K+/H+ antiporter
MVPIALDHVDTVVVLYALLSLTVVRMIPVALSLLGKRLRGDTIVFLGWFGPRGIASILFALLVVDESMLSSREEILAIVVAVVLLSVFAHGLTASPAARWYADRLGQPEPGMTEHDTVAEMPLRLGSSVPDS